MSWTRLATTPEFIIYEDGNGHRRLRSTVTGRFVPTDAILPDYGRGGYGETVSLRVE